MTTKNKHGRKGVKVYNPKRPLSEEQQAESRQLGKKEGILIGARTSLELAVKEVNSAKNIRDARRRVGNLLSQIND